MYTEQDLRNAFQAGESYGGQPFNSQKNLRDETDYINSLNIDRYPKAFLTRAGCLFKRSSTDVSSDGTPRYIPNPNAIDTYSLKTCLTEYTPIF